MKCSTTKKQSSNTSKSNRKSTHTVAIISCETSEEEEDGICEECGIAYCDDSEGKEKWMGCDTCPRWYHYDCLGYTCIPTGTWSYDSCLTEN